MNYIVMIEYFLIENVECNPDQRKKIICHLTSLTHVKNCTSLSYLKLRDLFSNR